MLQVMAWLVMTWVALVIPVFVFFTWIALTDPRWKDYGWGMRRIYLQNCFAAACIWPWFIPWSLWLTFRKR